MGQGNSREQDRVVVPANEDRQVFIKLLSYQRLAGTFTTPVIYRYELRYQRYMWIIEKRFHEITQLDSALQREFPEVVTVIKRPPTYWLWTPDKAFFDKRAQRVADYLQQLCDSKDLFDSKKLKLFLELSAVSFSPELGRKSIKEGYLKKSSGGYTEKFSRKLGDYFTYWRWRYFVLHDNCISWYRDPQSLVPQGSIQIDRDFHFHAVGRIIVVTTATRRIRMAAASLVEANSWMQAITQFYATTRRRYVQPFMSSCPVRENCDMRVYTHARDYMASVAVALLSAQQEIFITSWKNSPTVLVSRPPLPPLRLDQILRYKAEQGVKIYILLYKEVEFAGQGNDSQKAKTYLESLSPNICVLRHPNKIMGGSTAVMWSHHEKLVVVDRNMAFVGGIDLAFNRWDDEQKSLADEDGLRYPGKDYRQPAEGIFKPVRNPFVTSIGANGQVEVTMIDAASASLPVASADVVTLASVYDADVDNVVSPYTTATANMTNPGEQLIGAGGEARVMSCDFGVMNLDRRTNTTTQSRHDNARSTRLVSTPNSLATSGRTVGGYAGSNRHVGAGADDSVDHSSIHGAVSTTLNQTHHDFSRPYRARGDTVVSAESKNGDAESRLSILEEKREREVGLTPDELAAFAREDNDTFADSSKPAMSSAPTAPITAVAMMSSEGQDIYNMEQPITAAVAAGDITIVPPDNNSSAMMGDRQPQTGGAMSIFFSAASDFVNNVKDTLRDAKQPQRAMLRETHPRMPWHDLHSAVSGGPARDVASHFIQRWNHHRLATGNYDAEALIDTTDDTCFGVCARCGQEKIFETATHCPRCNLYLGPISPYLEDLRPDLLPESPDSFSYITFECKFPGSMLCRFLGDCPVVITQLIPPAREEDFFCEGTLIEESGDMTAELFTLGLVPAVGDIIVAVSGHVVTQLDHLYLDRFIKRQQDLLAETKTPLSIHFRRHYVADNFQGLKDDAIMEATNIGTSSATSITGDDDQIGKWTGAQNNSSSSCAGSLQQLNGERLTGDDTRTSVADDSDIAVDPNKLGSSTSNTRKRGSVKEALDGAVYDVSKKVESATALANSAMNALKGRGGESLAMVCQLTATREIALSISKLFHVVN
jgi:phosphatidylserine/phosphatidylglycerophosphate/cardiolipin synthase-like enzyme